jgi:hypothetical protein
MSGVIMTSKIPNPTTAAVAIAALFVFASFQSLFAEEATPDRPCVLLENDNVLFGVAKQIGEFVIIQSGRGGEVKLPRTSVACWSSSLQDLYQYRVDHRKDGVLAHHIRDANWCLKNDLRELATKELETIKKIAPNHPSIPTLERRINLASKASTAPQSLVIQQPGPIASSESADSDAELAGAESSPPSAAELLALRRFASHIQPMMVNLCGNCHSQSNDPANDQTNDTASFVLNLPPPGSRASSQMTRENLAATMAFIDQTNPDHSDLLIKATSAHGGVDAPLKMRNAKAIYSLRSWLMLASNAQATSTIQRASHESAIESDEVPFIAERPAFNETPVAKPTLRASNIPSRLPQVANPFDPKLFNRRFHPEENGN